MTWNSYLMELVWMLTAGLLIDANGNKHTERIDRRSRIVWSWTSIILLVLPLVLWAAFRTDAFGDTGAYRRGFQNAPTNLSQIWSYIAEAKKDRGYSAVTVILKMFSFNSSKVFFFLLAGIQMYLMIVVLRKYSCDFWLSIFIFVASTDYLSWMHNGIRQFTAAVIIFSAMPFLWKKQIVPAVIAVLAASLIHQSALIMLPVLFIIQGRALNLRSLLFLLVAIVVLFYVDVFTDLLDRLLDDTQYTNVVTEWKMINDDGTNAIRVAVYSVPLLIAMTQLRNIRKINDPMVNLAVNASAVTTGIYLVSMATSGIFVGRMPIYTSLMATMILLPWEIHELYTPESAKLIKLAAVAAYSLLFIYQVLFTWGLR